MYFAAHALRATLCNRHRISGLSCSETGDLIYIRRDLVWSGTSTGARCLQQVEREHLKAERLVQAFNFRVVDIQMPNRSRQPAGSFHLPKTI